MLSIRAATVNDVALLKALIGELAEYERERDLVLITETDLVRDGFGAQPDVRALIAEWDGQAAGYDVCFRFCSTWEQRPRLLLAALLVTPPFPSARIRNAVAATVFIDV